MTEFQDLMKNERGRSNLEAVDFVMEPKVPGVLSNSSFRHLDTPGHSFLDFRFVQKHRICLHRRFGGAIDGF